MKLSIITLTYNKLEYTKKYIESLYKYTKDFELIIVDNGSTDGTVDYIKSLQKDNIKLIVNNENLGFSKGNNQGLEIASGEYIGFLNNDILLYPNWFEECEKVFQKENVGFISPRHVNPHYDNTDNENYIYYFRNNFNYKIEYEKNFDECVFSCVLTKREVLNKIGNFDENYSPAFFEDNDIKYRAILAGFEILVVNKVCFFHFGSVTSKAFNYNFERNKHYYYNKYPFAEYISTNAVEKYKLQHLTKQFKTFPLKQMYEIYLIITKIKNRLAKGFKKN